MAHSEYEPHRTELPDLTEDVVTVDLVGGVLTLRGDTTGTVMRFNVEDVPRLAHILLAEWAECACEDWDDDDE